MKQNKIKKERKKLEKKEVSKRLIKDRIIRDIRTLFEKEEDCYKRKRTSTFWKKNHIEYESDGDKNRT